MLAATAPVLLLDYFRVPYSRLDGAEPIRSGEAECGTVSVRGESGSLTWVRSSDGGASGLTPGAYRLDTTAIFGHVLPDVTGEARLARLGASWEARVPIYGAIGEHEPTGDRVVGQSLGHQLEHLALALGQRAEAVGLASH